MFNWLKKRIAKHAGMDETSVLLHGWVPYDWVADFIIARTTYRDTVQRICLIKTTKGDMWEISDAE